MPSISGSSLLATQTYATQVQAPIRPPAASGRTALDGRADAGSAFSVALSEAGTNALAGAADATFRPFVSAADMGARIGMTASPTQSVTNRDFNREAPLRASEPPARHQRPGSQLDIKV